MADLINNTNQIHGVDDFKNLINTPFRGPINAIRWKRTLVGDFSEIVEKVALNGNVTELNHEELCELELSEQGQLAREVLLNDLRALKAHGASPVLNVIKYYERDTSYPLLPTDVYSFHVDRSPVATDTFLCTYDGPTSEILPNAQAKQKVLIPELRSKLLKLYDGPKEGVDSFLRDCFFDLHYQAEPNAQIVKLGIGELWRIAVDHPKSIVLPCLHRAPEEKDGFYRLMLIC